MLDLGSLALLGMTMRFVMTGRFGGGRLEHLQERKSGEK